MWGLLKRRGFSGFSPSSTAEEVTASTDGSGLVAIVTGASHGIGAETCRVLALRGVHVVMGVRNLSIKLRPLYLQLVSLYLKVLIKVQPVCYLALHPRVAGVTGKYFIDFNAIDLKGPATDKELARRLWDFSLSLLETHGLGQQ
ncbi:unnamed protein product [Urochloa decumbens]|uniref:Uncharacterized protein n=1 Tax=Urochloa decumbens TaxID=240449 RepID=A0ABC9CYN6_9POAL